MKSVLFSLALFTALLPGTGSACSYLPGGGPLPLSAKICASTHISVGRVVDLSFAEDGWLLQGVVVVESYLRGTGPRAVILDNLAGTITIEGHEIDVHSSCPDPEVELGGRYVFLHSLNEMGEGRARWALPVTQANLRDIADRVLLLDSATTTSFRQGENGYEGTVVTRVSSRFPDTVFTGTEDTQSPGDTNSHGLIRFDHLFGNGPGQIPPGSLILDAQLSGVLYHGRILQPWDPATLTWSNAFGGDGIQADGVEAARTTLDYEHPSIYEILTVGADLDAWSRDPASAHGWFVPFGGLTTERHPDISRRPQLTVTYIPPAVVQFFATPDGAPATLAVEGTQPGLRYCLDESTGLDSSWTETMQFYSSGGTAKFPAAGEGVRFYRARLLDRLAALTCW